jgi:hypothetical protein
MTKTREVQVNEKGRRIGQSHPRAKLNDHEIDLIRELYDDLRAEGKTNRGAAKLIAAKFEGADGKTIHPRTVQKYVYCEQRAQTAAKAKRVKK